MPDPRGRIAFLSYSNGRFDSRTHRMARSAMAAGHDVIVYARLEPGLPVIDRSGSFTIVRAPFSWRLAVPGLRNRPLRRYLAAWERALRDPDAAEGAAAATQVTGESQGRGAMAEAQAAPRRRPTVRDLARRTARARWMPTPLTELARGTTRLVRRAIGLVLLFPLRPIGWAVALEQVATQADLWHGMWAGSLPAQARLRRRHGGRTIYDSRDVYLHARAFDTLPGPIRGVFRVLERHWARRADAVITVNDAYAREIESTLGVRVRAIVMNCPDVFDAPATRPDRIRERLQLPQATRIVLYQGNFMTERGIEQGMDAILDVPDAVLVLLGFGALRDQLAAAAAAPPYLGRVHVLDGVPPDELLSWTASADVMLMAIQPTTLNHHHTTPNKLWEALAAGVPVVASDLPGMAAIVRESGAGVLCDPVDPGSIAAAIRAVLDAPPEVRQAFSAAARRAAVERYNWDAQAAPLLSLYARLLAG